MIIQKEKKEVARSQEFKTINYGVNTENLPLLFQMLRTNLYSDLYGSIIREVVSNVQDAHTEAGKKDAIGEIEWVNENRLLGVDCQLIIRDFGIGLSPERMETVYGNYLSSTKRGDNDSIGGFGLGSKVPFAYTDSFFVETVSDKIKYRYLCYIDETQLGAISLLGKESVERCNGTEIIIPIKNPADKSKFQEAIIEQLSYFTHIKYINFNPPHNAVVYEDEYCVILEDPPHTETHIVLGKVAYKIDFAGLGLSFHGMGHNNSRVGVKFAIGELQPTLSREGLFWSEASKKLVIERIGKASDSIRKKIELEVGKETDWAKWYSMVSTNTTKTFKNQWFFARAATGLCYVSGGLSLQVTAKVVDWFAGHSIRKVSPYIPGYNRRRRNHGSKSVTTATPDYSTSDPEHRELGSLPIFSLEKNLSSKTSLWLFNQYPSGFIVVREKEEKPEDKEELKYYKETKKWVKNLPKFEELPVPEDAPESLNENRLANYKEVLKARKLEGKFTAKRLVPSYDYSLDIESSFEYRMFESKFEEQKKAIIVYGLQEDHSDLCKFIAAAYRSREYAVKVEKQEILVLKVSQSLLKSFAQMPNAHYVQNVLSFKTPLTSLLESVITATKVKNVIHQFHILQFFENINADMRNTYVSLHKFVEQYAVFRPWFRNDLKQWFMDKHPKISDKKREAQFQKILDYFKGVELLSTPNFKMYSTEHVKSGERDGTTVEFLREYVSMNSEHIIELLVERGKEVDTVPTTAAQDSEVSEEVVNQTN